MASGTRTTNQTILKKIYQLKKGLICYASIETTAVLHDHFKIVKNHVSEFL